MTNFSYITGIPATANNPSTDQPNMMINNDSNEAIWDVDHVGFNAADGGTHLQVTFSSENTPSTPASGQAVLYTDDVGGQPALFFVNPVNSGYYINASNGGTVLTGGILMQWGSFTISAGQTQSATITFPTAFPSAIWSLQITTANSTPTNNAPSYTTGGTANFVAYRPGTTGTITYTYLAIGR